MRFIVNYIPKNPKDCPFYNNGKCYDGQECDNECFKNPTVQPPAECNGMISLGAIVNQLYADKSGDIYLQ